jgi:uncharacterized membrane protein YbhN (UPF0104 family)
VSAPRQPGRRSIRLVALLVVTALVVLAARRLSPARVLGELALARPGWVLLALGCFACILPLWALQWRLLVPRERHPPVWTMLGVVAMTSTVLNTTPLLVGEAAGVFFLVTEAGLSHVAAVSVLAMDQLFVGLAKLFVIGGAATAVTVPLGMARGAYALFAAVTLLLAGIVVAAWRSDHLSRSLERVAPPRVVRLVVSLGAALAPIRSPARSGGALGLALAKKAAEALALLCLQRAFGVELHATSALVILAATNLATLLPVVPGNLGVYEAAVVVAYSWLGIPPERALSIAVVQHACYFTALALPGYRWLAGRTPVRNSAAAA